MSLLLNDTIAAIASPTGCGLRGIVRISGPDVLNVLRRAIAWDESARSPRVARRYAASLSAADGTQRLPISLQFWPTQRSFTGEPLAELHLPGAPPLLNEALQRVQQQGARPAQRGEFTLRAFLAGRIDLVQAEAVLGVIDAGNELELHTALGQLAGGISHRIAALREELLLHLADLEAGLDFVEEDIEFVSREDLQRRLHAAAEFLRGLRAQSARRMLSTGRPRVALAGLPNAGKSTLLNRLAGRAAALVSAVPGTTRDFLSVALEHQGVGWDLIDTAGSENPRDEIEAAAGRLRDDQFRRAQLIVWCSAADLSAADAERDRDLRRRYTTAGIPVLTVLTKADRADDENLRSAEGTSPGAGAEVRSELSQGLAVSALRGGGLGALQDAIVAALTTGGEGSEMIAATAARCGESLHAAEVALERARALALAGGGDELIALELRDALDHLGRIVGKVYADDILDRIFSRFCIGK